MLTLAKWLENFCAKEDEIRALGFDDRFLRFWKYYLPTARQASRKIYWTFATRLAAPAPDRAEAGHSSSRIGSPWCTRRRGDTPYWRHLWPLPYLPVLASRNHGSPRTGRHSHWHGRRHCCGRDGRLDFSASTPLARPHVDGWSLPVFGTSLPAFEPFLSKRFWLTPVLGIVGGVGAYTSAGTFGAVFGEAGRLTMVVSVGLLWATAFPLLVHLAKRQNQ